MNLVEGLFGRVQLPAWARDILLSPEVQRLRDVRLINTATPYLPALSDARRFTHTVGVAHLANESERRLRSMYSRSEIRALIAAAIVHDVGSPPFGHLFEYLLKAQSGWTHEAALTGILQGDYRPDNIYHQIYFGNSLALARRLERAKIDPELVAGMVKGQGSLGPLLAGTIDFDNIDNVFRMTMLLDLRPDIRVARELAGSLSVEAGALVVERSGIGALEIWRSLRRAAYDILAFNPEALAGQAMLTDAISNAMQSGLISAEQWHWTDDELLRQLTSSKRVKSIRKPAQRFVVGDFYQCLGVFQYDEGSTSSKDLRLPSTRDEVAEEISAALGVECSIYAFYDKGTFEKQLTLRVRDYPDSLLNDVTVGETSKSTIVSVFTPRRSPIPLRSTRATILGVLSAQGLTSDTETSSNSRIRRKEGSSVCSQAELPL